MAIDELEFEPSDWDDPQDIEQRIEELREEKVRIDTHIREDLKQAHGYTREIGEIEGAREEAEDLSDDVSEEVTEQIEAELRGDFDHIMQRVHEARLREANIVREIHVLGAVLHGYQYWLAQSKHEQQRIVAAIETVTS